MNYTLEQIERLAAAYALGALRGRARARFERLCGEQPQALARRQAWEDRLLPLALAVPPQRVSALLWSGIRLRLAESGAGTHAPAPRAVRLGGLRGVAAASIAVLALLFAGLLYQARPDWRVLANLTPPNGSTQWHVHRSGDYRRLRVIAVGETRAPNGGSYELWVLPAAGGNPVSLGIIPARGEETQVLDERQRELLRSATTIAVSLEPGGGSRSGLPTQVQFAAPVERTG
jgi:anti-sigma-K factor RskA